MANAIIYCDRCGMMIPPSGIRGGSAIVGDTVGICPACVAEFSDEERETFRRKLMGEPEPKPRRPAYDRDSAGSTGSSRKESGRLSESHENVRAAARPKKMFAVAIPVAGLLVGFAVTLLVMLGGDEGPVGPQPGAVTVPARSQKVGPARTVTVPRTSRPSRTDQVGAATPAAKRMAEIKDVFAPWYRNHAEGRRLLKEFLDEFPSGPEADKARARLAEFSMTDATSVKTELAKVVERASSFASRDMPDRAAKVLDAARKRFDKSEWFKAEGEKAMAPALVAIAKSRLKIATSAVERARDLLDEEQFDAADRALLKLAEWPDAIRREAEQLTARIASARAEAENESKRADAWIDCRIGFEKAGQAGLDAVKSHIERELKRLKELGVEGRPLDSLSRMKGRIRYAKFVEGMAAMSLEGTKRNVRIKWKGRALAIKVVGVEDGIVRAKVIGGEEQTFPISRMSTDDVIAQSRILRGDTKDPVRAGWYLFLRGEFDRARKVLDGLASDGALSLGEDIDLIASAIEDREKQ